MPALVGTSGWSYKDWEGPVYPKDLPRAEQLPFYARHRPTVEVNTTFYRTPPRRMIEGWIERTKDVPRFELTVKGPRDLTQKAMAKESPAACARLAREWADAVPRVLAEAERLGAVFLQLSPGVLHNRDSLERLERVLEALQDFPVAVELRNKTWLEPPDRQHVQPDALQTLDAYDAALVAVDGPSWPNMLFDGHATHGYVRFHGRNVDVWHRGRVVEKDPEDPRMDRYDYKYDPKQLRPWADAVREQAREKTVRVYFNNHPGGQAYHDARIFDGLLAGRARPEAETSAQRRLV